MRILITGAGGFVGTHLLKELATAGHSVIAADRQHPPVKPDIISVPLEITDAAAVTSLVRSKNPDACIHLAALSFVPDGNTDPSLLFSINVTGTINLLEAFRKHAPHAKILVVSTSHVYGFQPSNRPLTENAPLQPESLYAASKAMADLATLTYASSFSMHTMVVRPCNHVGPHQSERFSIASFARQIHDIRKNRKPPILLTGNLDSSRDFLDVRDVVRAYRLLLDKGQPGHAYNMISGHQVKVRTALEMLCSIARIEPEIRQDPSRTRPTDTPPALDDTRLRKDTGWAPTMQLETTLRDILEAMETT